MRRIKLLLPIVFLTISTLIYAQNGWFAQSNITQNNIRGIEFINSMDGYLLSNNGVTSYIYSTSNGGQTWNLDTSINLIYNQLATIGGNVFACGNNGAILKKASSSSTYTSLNSQTTVNLNDIYFIHPDTGFAVGNTGVLRKTVDGGTTWTNPIISGFNYDFLSVWFTSPSNGVIVGVYNFFQGFAIQTGSGGNYWGNFLNMPSKLNKVTFSSPQIGYAVGNGGIIYKTTNGGTGWILKTSGVSTQLWDVSFVNDTIGWAVGDNGTILKTLNGGTTWQQQTAPAQANLRSVYVASNLNAWAAGDTNIVFKTSTGGLTLSVAVADTSVYCQGSVQLQAVTSYNGSGTLQYSWASNSSLSDTSIANPVAGPLSTANIFYITVTDGLLTATDSAIVNVVALPTDTICLVTFDDSLNKNLIVFEKHVQGAIDYYKIYKETSVAFVYDSIGFIPADSAGIFIDTAANPAIQAYRYKISVVDSCGNESLLSNHHKTIHLTINQGLPGTWNLIWNNYEGVFINTYRIWRGSTQANLVLIDSVAGNMTSYTDLNPLPGSIFYQIEIVSSYMCLPYNYKAKTNYNTSRSNKAVTGAPPVVTAGFSATPTTGLAPLTVFFTDGSMGSIDTYIWNFGDGDTAMTANPSHTYTTPGIYDVTLYVKSGILIDSITKTAFIDVVSSIDEIDSKTILRVYPNPSKAGQTIYVNSGDLIMNSIEIYDSYGRMIYKTDDINSSSTQINTTELHGVYTVKVTSKHGDSAYQKLIVH